LNYSILGAFGNALRPGVVIRNEQSFASFVSLVNRTRLSLLQKQITSNVIFKTGLQSTVTNAPPVFTTLVDNMLDQTQLIVDNKPIRNNSDNMIAKTYGGRNFDTVWPGGYNGFSFVDSQNPLTAYRGDGLQGGSTFEIDTNVISANAANLILMVQEQIFGGPFPPLKPGA
jgi:type IV secretory pathway VirB6-like protein